MNSSTGMVSVPMDVHVLVYEQVEVLDFAGPFEVFSCAARLQRREGSGGLLLGNVDAVAEIPGKFMLRGGIEVLVRRSLQSKPPPAIVVVPGGVVTGELTNQIISEWLRACAQGGSLILSVCTGAFLLAQAGLLDGQQATTHWEDLDDFRKRYPLVKVRGAERYIEAGNIVTSAGISAGIDASLHLVGRTFGLDLAQRTAQQMDYGPYSRTRTQHQ